jgi:hypothetical protein
MDEYTHAHITCEKLNLLCDGMYQFRKLYQNVFQQKVIVIICGNKKPSEVYPVKFDRIEARFREIKLTFEHK